MDNTQLNPGAGGDMIAADDIGGVKFQRVKLVHGDDGQSDGDVSAKNGLPVFAQSLEVLRRIASLLKPLQQVTGGGSNRLSVDVANLPNTLNTVNSIGAVTTVNNLANVWAFDQAKSLSRSAFNSGIRSRIS